MRRRHQADGQGLCALVWTRKLSRGKIRGGGGGRRSGGKEKGEEEEEGEEEGGGGRGGGGGGEDKDGEEEKEEDGEERGGGGGWHLPALCSGFIQTEMRSRSRRPSPVRPTEGAPRGPPPPPPRSAVGGRAWHRPRGGPHGPRYDVARDGQLEGRVSRVLPPPLLLLLLLMMMILLLLLLLLLLMMIRRRRRRRRRCEGNELQERTPSSLLSGSCSWSFSPST